MLASRSEELLAHVEICPWCKKKVEQDEANKGYAGEIPAVEKHRLPGPGEIWFIDRSLAGWGEKNRHYNSPAVLVLDVLENTMADVLQVYDDPLLQAEDDIPLDPKSSLFAETWNRYTIRLQDLHLYFGRVDDALLVQCRESCEAVGKKAGSTEELTKIEQGSLLWFFRNLEVETGFFFARQSIALALNTYQEADHTVTALPADEFLSQLSEVGLNTDRVPKSSEDGFDILPYIAIPDEYLSMAAADGEMDFDALQLSLDQGKISRCGPLNGVISLAEEEDGILLVTGELELLDEEVDEIFCWLETGDGMLESIEEKTGFEKGLFWTAFSLIGRKKSDLRPKLILRCIRY